MSQLFELLDNSSDSPTVLLSFLESTWISPKYHSVYVSFGSKFNSSIQHFSFPTTIRNKSYSSNASYQMIPQFLREPSISLNTIQKRSLVIVVDIFNNEETVNQNRQLLRHVLDSSITTMDVIMFDHDITQKSLKKLVKGLVKLLILHDIQAKRCMFCNYIRFAHPNPLEYAVENFVPTVIQNALEKAQNKQYNHCFYQWYGPTIYAYNMVYNYKKYDMFWSMNCGQLMALFQQAMAEPRHISQSKIAFVEYYLATELPAKHLTWKTFCDYSFDICAHRSECDPFPYSLGLKYLEM